MNAAAAAPAADEGSIAFIGGGQMASAMVKGLLKAGRAPSTILVIEPAEAQRESLRSSLQVQVAEAAGASLAGARVVVWATKPQVLRDAIAQALPHLPPGALHISIAAGIPLDALARWTGSRRVVRAMPNTAALVGAGVAGMAAASEVSEQDRHAAAAVLAATGHCFWVPDDERLDAVTAISGSGPAYVFHFLEAFQAAAQALGFDAGTARELVLRTAAGAIEQARLGEPFDTLRTRVTSRRGTTEAALRVLDERATPRALVDAARAAYERAGDLSRELAA